MPTYRTKTSRANCVCPPLFGSQCLLNEYFDFSGDVSCVVPESNSPAGKVRLYCSAWCKKADGSKLNPIIDIIGGVPNVNFGNCTFGWQYICEQCASNKITVPDIGPGSTITPACGDYCCASWGGQNGGPGSTKAPGSDLLTPCSLTPGTPGVCADGVWLFMGGIKSSARCKKAQRILYTDPHGFLKGCGNWMAAVNLESATVGVDWGSGPCWMSGPMKTVSDLTLYFAVDCGNDGGGAPGSGQDNVIGCSTNDVFKAGDPGVIISPVTGKPRRLISLHMNLVAWSNSAGGGVIEPFTCSAADLANCFLDFAETYP